MSYEFFLKKFWSKTALFLNRTCCFTISFYQKAISPWLGHHCRFEPTCSKYAKEAIQTCGIFRGGLLAAKRLLSCHPWGHRGYDPVVAANQAVLK